jgi:hypothetical protein
VVEEYAKLAKAATKKTDNDDTGLRQDVGVSDGEACMQLRSTAEALPHREIGGP